MGELSLRGAAQLRDGGRRLFLGKLRLRGAAGRSLFLGELPLHGAAQLREGEELSEGAADSTIVNASRPAEVPVARSVPQEPEGPEGEDEVARYYRRLNQHFHDPCPG